jgi:uncharacterized membrane protein YbhN (UPF0104 family)
MRKALIAGARLFHEKLGWNGLGFLVSIAIIAVAIVTLVRVLRDVRIEKVVSALYAMSWENVALAALLVAAAYFTLTFYDYFSLWTINRRHVPYRVAALASFTSYSIGHNLGLTVLTGGAVRFRIYSAWGLTVVDVAKIAFVTGLTFWLGNAFVLGLGMLAAPEAATAVDQLPPIVNRIIALAGLAAIVGYLIWLIPRPRIVGVNDFTIQLPGARLTLVQIVIGIADLSLSGLAMFFLLPGAPAIDFLPVLVTFVLATLLGFVSHAPGALGVFDAAMLVGLSQFSKEELLASLLVYRCLYYILPFALALTTLAVRELWLNFRLPALKADIGRLPPAVVSKGVPQRTQPPV